MKKDLFSMPSPRADLIILSLYKYLIWPYYPAPLYKDQPFSGESSQQNSFKPLMIYRIGMIISVKILNFDFRLTA